MPDSEIQGLVDRRAIYIFVVTFEFFDNFDYLCENNQQMSRFFEINNVFSRKKLSIYLKIRSLEKLLSETIFHYNKD